MRATNLDDARKLVLLPFERVMERFDSWQQGAHDLFCGRHVHGGRVRVVGRLTHVHVIVRVHGLPAPDDATTEFDRTVRDHLVGIHVGVRARSGLPHR